MGQSVWRESKKVCRQSNKILDPVTGCVTTSGDQAISLSGHQAIRPAGGGRKD
jgi:hypothetical protein